MGFGTFLVPPQPNPNETPPRFGGLPCGLFWQMHVPLPLRVKMTRKPNDQVTSLQHPSKQQAKHPLTEKWPYLHKNAAFDNSIPTFMIAVASFVVIQKSQCWSIPLCPILQWPNVADLLMLWEKLFLPTARPNASTVSHAIRSCSSIRLVFSAAFFPKTRCLNRRLIEFNCKLKDH